MGQYDVVANCTGFRSRELVGDKAVYPVRGHLIRVCTFFVVLFLFINVTTNAVSEIVKCTFTFSGTQCFVRVCCIVYHITSFHTIIILSNLYVSQVLPIYISGKTYFHETCSA